MSLARPRSLTELLAFAVTVAPGALWLAPGCKSS